MQDPRLQELWKDPANWNAIGLYRCADDPRWWVPKRDPWMGWTINIAHRGAIFSLIALMVVVTVPAVVLSIVGSRGRPLGLIIVVLAIPLAVTAGFILWIRSRDS